MRRSKHHGFLQMTKELIRIRRNYAIAGGNLMVHGHDLERGIVLFSVEKDDVKLFCVLNLSESSIGSG